MRTYLESKTELRKIIVIYGPTASGKTQLSLSIAHEIEKYGYTPHIISADSRQIYRGLDIGTGKIKKTEMQGFCHHMIDIIDPSEKYSMIQFRRDVDALPFWQEKNVIPILCGGTGLYIDAILYDMDYPENPPDWKYREELENIRKKEGNEALWKMLEAVDPLYANTLHKDNYRYIIRGLEVIRNTGKSKYLSYGTKKLRFSPIFITPYQDGKHEREELYKTIDNRVRTMFSLGLIEEVGYNMNVFGSDCPGLLTIGYKEVVHYLQGRSSLDECIQLVAQHSRNYAKRQITWNKRYG